MRNPDWVRNEVVLKMDLHVRAGRKQLPIGHEEVVRLSNVLNRFPLLPPGLRAGNLRNPPNFSTIFGNFRGIDPIHEPPGLSSNNQLQSVVWKDFIGDLDSLHSTAQAIQPADSDAAQASTEEVFDEEASLPEGHLLKRLHLTQERNRAVVTAKLNEAWRKEGCIACEACGFDFLVVYGELGRCFAECHHLVPLSDEAFAWNTRISDLAIVCANCHRMLHRGRHAPTMDALRDIASHAKLLQPGGVA